MSDAPLQIAETAFEKRRGVSRVEARPGFAQVHVSQLGEPLTERRLQVLGAVADGGISIDFLKLTQTGLSFLIDQSQAATVSEVLEQLAVRFSLREDRLILMVHAVNMRDEEGLLARTILEAIASEVRVDHVSDMHDRMLLVVAASEGEALKARIEQSLMGAPTATPAV